MKKTTLFLLSLAAIHLSACNKKTETEHTQSKSAKVEMTQKEVPTQIQKESNIQLIPCGTSDFIHQPNEKASVKQTLEQLKRTHPELKVLSHGKPYKEDGMGKGWSMQIFIEK